MNIYEKLTILADGAKYDASCSTSGVDRKNSGKMGNAASCGICHSWSADGRCISLLKVLMTNRCVYNCEYCVNRRSAEAARASFEPEELARLTMEFYRRNYIEGLFLSSAVEVSPDHTAERMLRCLQLLREDYGFAGYIHAKIIPGVSRELVHAIGLAADRISVNIELPSGDSLARLAPQKKREGIFQPMKQISETIADRKQLKSGGDALWDGGNRLRYLEPEGKTAGVSLPAKATARRYKERFAPGGQTTQMIIGASPETDRQIVRISESLYRTFRIKRVYFSAYIPVNESPILPPLLTPPPLMREHRLYQADWLLRFYGFQADEILDDQNPFLDPQLDPKVMWALRNIQAFPIEVNKASLEDLMRVPGIGYISARRIVRQRRLAAVKFEDLKKMGVAVKRARFFVLCCGRYHGDADLDPEEIRGILTREEGRGGPRAKKDDGTQISMFETALTPSTAKASSAPAFPLPIAKPAASKEGERNDRLSL